MDPKKDTLMIDGKVVKTKHLSSSDMTSLRTRPIVSLGANIQSNSLGGGNFDRYYWILINKPKGVVASLGKDLASFGKKGRFIGVSSSRPCGS